MGLYTSDRPDVPGMRGLHLFHFVMSNCSQRVRIALEEKDLPWTSHHLNLAANEHVTEDYQWLNPNGVVPTLVHDGQVVIESNDILAYLEDHFPEPAPRPASVDGRGEMEARIAESSAFQSTIKVLSHELLFRPFRQMGADEIALYQEKHNDPALVSWIRDYAEAGPAWRERVERAQQALKSTLDALEAALAACDWLSGQAYGLADISWVVNFHRLNQAQVDLSPWPRFAAWGKRATDRPAFGRAVIHYTP